MAQVVPRSLEDLTLGAVCIAATCELAPHDVCACPMPLYHVGGIVRNLLAPLLSGGATLPLPSAEPHLFWHSVSSQAATWYYAGPTIHLLILEAYHAEGAAKAPGDAARRLRFVANAAGPLLHATAKAIAAAYDCVVLPSYGLTECMPVSAPPLTYRLDRPGSSGLPVGPTVQIHDMAGAAVEAGTSGRIVLQGHPVMSGYEMGVDHADHADGGASNGTSNGTSNGSASLGSMPMFATGSSQWFATGDNGYIDGDGWLFLVGREKEAINRGGETPGHTCYTPTPCTFHQAHC